MKKSFEIARKSKNKLTKSEKNFQKRRKMKILDRRVGKGDDPFSFGKKGEA